MHYFKCQHFGQKQNTCRGKLTCTRCGQFTHDNKTCVKDVVCIYCKGNHCAYSSEYLQWKLEKTGSTGLSTEKAVIPRDQKAGRDSDTKSKTYAAVAAVPKPIAKGVAVNTELTWHCEDVKQRKLSDIAKTEKQVTERQNSNSEQRIARGGLGFKKSIKWVEH